MPGCDNHMTRTAKNFKMISAGNNSRFNYSTEPTMSFWTEVEREVKLGIKVWFNRPPWHPQLWPSIDLKGTTMACKGFCQLRLTIDQIIRKVVRTGFSELRGAWYKSFACQALDNSKSLSLSEILLFLIHYTFQWWNPCSMGLNINLSR